jgi:hypothetical protein
MTTRRSFIQIIPVAGIAIFGTEVAFAGVPELDPKDPQAVALGYQVDAAKADKVKFPKYAAGQQCGNCQLYQGKAGDASGLCALFAGKSVQGKGWCSAYTKKP